MSKALHEIVNQLSGLNLVKAKLDSTSERIEKIADILIDHEKRISKAETMIPVHEKRLDKSE